MRKFRVWVGLPTLWNIFCRKRIPWAKSYVRSGEIFFFRSSCLCLLCIVLSMRVETVSVLTVAAFPSYLGVLGFSFFSSSFNLVCSSLVCEVRVVRGQIYVEREQGYYFCTFAGVLDWIRSSHPRQFSIDEWLNAPRWMADKHPCLSLRRQATNLVLIMHDIQFLFFCCWFHQYVWQ